MKIIKIYTSGAEKNAPEGHNKWREELNNLASWHEDQVQIINPMEHFDYDKKYPTSSKQCRNYFMWLIDKCDVLLVNLDYSDNSVGTGRETQHALDTKKPIIGFGTNKDTWYEWDTEDCEVIFETIDDALDYIIARYCI